MAWRKTKSSKQHIFLYVATAAILIYLAIVTVRVVYVSAIFARHDRVNVAFFGEEATILSFGLTDNVNYIVSLSHEQKIMIPGGYNQYPLGSLGKLVEIEKDPTILQRTFSSMTSAHINYFISPTKPDVYEKPDTDEPTYKKRDLIGKIFSSKYMSNMNIIDKLYVSYLIGKRRQQDYVVLRSTVRRDEDDGARIFSEKSFQKKYKGFFYHQSVREEGMEVQIRYSMYKSAVTLSRVIEGQGIRITDFSLTDRTDVKRCLIRTNESKKTHTVQFLKRALMCDVEQGETEGVDVVLYLGKDLEALWE